VQTAPVLALVLFQPLASIFEEMHEDIVVQVLKVRFGIGSISCLEGILNCPVYRIGKSSDKRLKRLFVA
jgi:hypothetical protein